MDIEDNEYYRITIDENTPCLEWIGKKFMPSQVFRESEQKSLEAFLKHRSKYSNFQWYVDARDIGVVSREDTEWVAENILPKMSAAGLRKEAFIVPKSALGRMTVKNYQSKAGEVIQIQVFGTPTEAKSWLKK